MRILKKALPLWGAFFVVCSLSVNAACIKPESMDQVRVEHVYDGDTVRLSDGRRIRIVGINAPEESRNEKPGEYLAGRATQALKHMLDRSHGRAELLLGVEQKDRHNRWLGHLFVGEDSVAESLLRQGLAFHIAIPPNLGFFNCLKEAELDARGKGLWAVSSHLRKQVSQLKAGESGFRVLRGSISTVKKIKRGWILELDAKLAVRLTQEQFKELFSFRSGSLSGLDVTIRGWIKPKSKSAPKYYMPWFVAVSHPSQLTVH